MEGLSKSQGRHTRGLTIAPNPHPAFHAASPCTKQLSDPPAGLIMEERRQEMHPEVWY